MSHHEDIMKLLEEAARLSDRLFEIQKELEIYLAAMELETRQLIAQVEAEV